MDCEACGEGSNNAYGSCKDCSISVCYDHDCMAECSNCSSYVCYACASSNQSDNGHCCSSCSSMYICECGSWEYERIACEYSCGSQKCSSCMNTCSNCGLSWCYGCRELTDFQGDSVCSDCYEGLADALRSHFNAGAEHDHWNEG